MNHRQLFAILGVPFTIDEKSWQFVPPKLFIGLIVAFITLPDLTLIARILMGLIFGVVLLIVLLLHIVGHILSGKWVGPAMDEAYITPILIQTLYHHDPPDTPGRIHLVRAMGGPLLNIALGSIGLLVWRNTGGNVLLFFSGANLILAAFVLLPFPTVDGEIIWRELSSAIRDKS